MVHTGQRSYSKCLVRMRTVGCALRHSSFQPLRAYNPLPLPSSFGFIDVFKSFETAKTAIPPHENGSPSGWDFCPLLLLSQNPRILRLHHFPTGTSIYLTTSFLHHGWMAWHRQGYARLIPRLLVLGCFFVRYMTTPLALTWHGSTPLTYPSFSSGLRMKRKWFRLVKDSLIYDHPTICCNKH